MKMLFLSVAVGVGFMLGSAVSADAKGGRSGQTAGSPHIPPGFSHGKGKTNGKWGTGTLNTTAGPVTFGTPPGWTNKSTNPSWNTTLGGPLPPGLSSCPSGLLGC